MAATQPCTPSGRTGKELEGIIGDLNNFGLQIPNPTISSPLSREKKSIEQRCFSALKQLHFNRKVDIYALIEEFKDLISPNGSQWVFKPQQEAGTLSSPDQFLRRNRYQNIPPAERERRLDLLLRMLDRTIQSVNMNEGLFTSSASQPSFTSTAPIVHDDDSSHASEPISLKRKSVEDAEVFQTAPSSPVMSLDDDTDINDPDWDDSIFDIMNTTDDCPGDAQKPEARKKADTRQRRISEFMKVGKFSEQKPVPPVDNKQDFSFATSVESDIFDAAEGNSFRNSFDTDITEPMDENMMPPATLMISDEQSDLEKWIIDELLQHGPFSKEQSFPGSVPIRYRYELERIAQQWDIPYDKIFVGERAPFSSHGKFWEWVKSHPQRGQNAVPDKSPIKAWDSAVEQFEVMDKHSEVVVFTGILDWCEKRKPGILNLTLNPLKIERSCRFHRRFGSDRFLSLTIPAPTLPPDHLRFEAEPSVLRESIVKWLTKNEHHYLGRTWKPFYVEEVKRKRKANKEIRFRVDFFAIKGLDFKRALLPPPVAPINQACDEHTEMGLDALLDWHLLRNANKDQKDCKLFQRIAIGLSKTWATVVLRPKEILHLEDDKNKPIMNDGCALMSRALAREICDNMGISGNTPSCFQGRIAGAKGLWMVDRQNSNISTSDRDFWLQVSDSQLKVRPHPQDWDPRYIDIDDAKLTFEVANWSKPLNQVNLNVQLLGILDYGGTIRAHVADLMRGGIKQHYQDFAEVIKRDDILLGRCLLQKLKPSPKEGMARNMVRRSDQWVFDDVECAIRFLEAGFSPRNFKPLRDCLSRSLESTLDRYVKDLHIHVPLSTYAFCIADPYGVLEEDEVHFGFSSQWQHHSFEDTLLDDIDVLVARLPAHLPSDVQRRRAVWRSELRHFKDVIVFPTRGTQPLAGLLSGGDYDGDIPWICWDKGIVETFINSSPPQNKPPEFFGLTHHATPMGEIQSTEDFLQRTFMFNLTVSNLGRCTVEHESIIYEEEESVNSEKAKELAMLLSHLVDARKAGVQLSENAWRVYQKKISPRPRTIPAYKTQQKAGNLSNIIDYLKFEVASKEKEGARKDFERLCNDLEAYDGGDKDLLRPWKTVWDRAIRERRENDNNTLLGVLQDIRKRIEDCYDQWEKSCARRPKRDITQFATGLFEDIQPPIFDHVLSHTWQESEHEWRILLASCAYDHSALSKFIFYAMGETVCRIKTGNAQSRLVKDEVYNILGISSRVSRRVLAREERWDNEDVLEADEAFEELAS
ncbi:hypothetical protein Egran_04940, partial [Elaphomyces granulatus]